MRFDPCGRRADDGTWLLVDIKALDTYAENVDRNPMASADVRHQRAELHELGAVRTRRRWARHARSARPAKAEAMARDAGFTRFRQLEVDHPINAFYEIRP